MAANVNDLLKKTGSNTVTTLSAPGKALGATSINVGSTTNYPTDTGIIIAIRQVDSSGNLVAGTYTEWSATVSSATSLAIVATPVLGSDQIYPAGSTTQVYIPVSSYAHNKLVDNILEHANQDGSLITQAVRDALNLDSGSSDGWTPFGYSLTSITALGNRSYTAVVSGVDTTGVTSVGMRLKLPRTVTAPTQCTSLNGTTQYFNRASAGLAAMTFTDDFVVSAWVKLESYTQGVIISRFNNTSGWVLSVNTAGTVQLTGYNASGGNYKAVFSYQSIPLNKWVHVAVQLDMSAISTDGTGVSTTTNYIMIDGVDVPASTDTNGTNPNTLIQAGNLEIGSANGGASLFDGKIAQVAIFSAKVTQATILASMNQTLTGSETSLLCGYTFNGVVTDVSSNGYTLTAQGGALATNADTPFTNVVTGTSVTAGTTNYGIIMAQTFSTNTTYTIQIPEGETLPTTGGIGTVSYSTQKTPYGFPGDAGKWALETRINSSITSQNLSTNVWSIFLSGLTLGIYLPIGAWRHGYKGSVQWSAGGVASLSGHIALTSSAPANSTYSEQVSSNDYDASTQYLSGPQHASGSVSLTAATQYNLYATYDQGTATVTCSIRGDLGSFTIFAENAYL